MEPLTHRDQLPVCQRALAVEYHGQPKVSRLAEIKYAKQSLVETFRCGKLAWGRRAIMGDGEERCPKFPSMLKGRVLALSRVGTRYCRESSFFDQRRQLGWLSCCGSAQEWGPVGPWDEHFGFGQRKAEMLIACMNILRKFWLSTDDERRAFPPQLVEYQTRGLRIQIPVEMDPDFERSTGQTIDRPYLRLQADDDHKVSARRSVERFAKLKSL